MIKTTISFQVEVPEKFSILTEAEEKFEPDVTTYEARDICSGKWICRKPDGSEELITTEEAAKVFFLAKQLGELIGKEGLVNLKSLRKRGRYKWLKQ